MKYLKRFNKQLKQFREGKRLSHQDIAKYCMVDPTVVEAWESPAEKARCYPTLDNLLDLCVKTGAALETFLDLPDAENRKQLELPGLAFVEDSDLNESLAQLDDQIEKLLPAEDEKELLRRYRKSDQQSKKLILQLIAN